MEEEGKAGNRKNGCSDTLFSLPDKRCELSYLCQPSRDGFIVSEIPEYLRGQRQELVRLRQGVCASRGIMHAGRLLPRASEKRT